MCGISGLVNKNGTIVDERPIRRMNDLIRHRGPDDEGFYFYSGLALAHRRLSILDLSPSGHQPMAYCDDEDYVIVFNGEVYNYIELRFELSAAGHTFVTTTDTEVILAAYAEWGQNCVSHFNGMWSFALLDKKKKILFCSRDRFGVKPFYYINGDSQLAFGSEIRQLLPILPKVLPNARLLRDFILTSACEHTNETFFAGVQKLPAGHNLVFDLEKSVLKIERYYELQANAKLATLGENEAVDLYKNSFTDSIALRLRADVPVATCLSGGLDSSSVATIASALYAQSTAGRFSAITAVSEQSNNDETVYAQQVVEHSHLNWLRVKPSYEDFVATLPQVVEAQEEPFTSPSLTMQFFVMKTARENEIPVLLDGQGGDETLLGYDKYYAAHFLTTLRRKGAGAAFKALHRAWKNNANMSPQRIVMYLVGGLFPTLRFYFYCWRHPYVKDKGGVPAHLKEFSKACADEFNIQHLEITKTNLPVLLRYEDKNSMHHSVEARLPFLDYRTLEIALSLPGEYKIRDGWAKWLLRRCMDGLMPPGITWRKNKMGFEAPEDLWLDRHRLPMQEAVFASPLLAVICDMNKLKKRYAKLDKRSRWRLYSIALWEKAFGVMA